MEDCDYMGYKFYEFDSKACRYFFPGDEVKLNIENQWHRGIVTEMLLQSQIPPILHIRMPTISTSEDLECMANNLKLRHQWEPIPDGDQIYRTYLKRSTESEIQQRIEEEENSPF